MKFSLVMVRPIATGSSMLDSWNFLLAITCRILTTCGFALGTSIPMVPLPGMGAIIRIPSAAKLNAMSSSRFLTAS